MTDFADVPLLHPELYHYTDYDGLKGIMESQTLWATHYGFLNDGSEIEYMRPRLIDKLTRPILGYINEERRKSLKVRRIIEKEGSALKVAREDAESTIDSLYGVTFENVNSYREPFSIPFITSFCSHEGDEYTKKNGLLSQWRAYGQGSGCAIVFDAPALSEMLKKESETYHGTVMQLCGVVYDVDQKFFEEAFDPLLKILPEIYKELIGLISRDTDDASLKKIYGPFVSSVSRFKHQAFKEEGLSLCVRLHKIW